MARTVLLRHDLPGGAFHYDWLIERPGVPGLLAFRVAVRIDDPACASFDAESMPDHRPMYLDYQGPVSAGRGAVSRLAAGTAEVTSASATRIELKLDFGGGPRSWIGDPMPRHGGDPATGLAWRFGLIPWHG